MALNITTCTKKKDGDCAVNYLKLLILLFKIDDRRYLARHLSRECGLLISRTRFGWNSSVVVHMHVYVHAHYKQFVGKDFLHVDLEVDLTAL